jgi:hypothetical protein
MLGRPLVTPVVRVGWDEILHCRGDGMPLALSNPELRVTLCASPEYRSSTTLRRWKREREMRITHMKYGMVALSILSMALAIPSLALAQRGGGRGGGQGNGGGRGGGQASGQRGGGQGSGGGQIRGGGSRGNSGRGAAYSSPRGGGNNGGDPRANSGRGAAYSTPRGGSNYGGDPRANSGRGAVYSNPRGGNYSGRGQAYVRPGGRPGDFYGGSRYNNYPGRYYSGYRGFNYGPNVRFGLGSGFGPYGYSYFPWYSGLGLYAGALGGGRGYGGYGYNNYGTGNYAGSYYSGAQTVPMESQTAPQQVPASEDYVPQYNDTMAELATAASGGAVLGITMDPQYPQAAVVREVTPGAPAERAGLRPGDMITSIDQKVVQSPDDVVTLIAAMQPGSQVAIQFVRPILRSEVQAAAPEQQLVPATTTPVDTLSPPPLPTPQTYR